MARYPSSTIAIFFILEAHTDMITDTHVWRKDTRVRDVFPTCPMIQKIKIKNWTRQVACLRVSKECWCRTRQLI